MEKIENLENKEIKVKQVKEGKVCIKQTNDSGTFSPFYNPSQELNRDISVSSIATYFDTFKTTSEKNEKLDKNDKNKGDKKFTLIDAMSATGLRAVRYLRELPENLLEKIYANDLDSKAVELIKENAVLNGDKNSIIDIHQKDAAALLYSLKNHFDVVDLDPYGTAVNLIDSAIWAVKNNGLILATFTDMQVLCGNYQETCYYKYGSLPYKTNYCHEMAKRIAMYTISTSAAKYKKTIIPLFSFNAEFYIRLIFMVKESPEMCQENVVKHGHVLQCRTCQYRRIIKNGIFEFINSKKKKSNGEMKQGKTRFRFSNFEETPDKCPVCDGHLIMIGPFYLGSLQNNEFIHGILNNLKSDYQYLKYNTRITGILNGALEENELDVPFGYSYSQLCSDVNLNSPKLSLIA